MTTTKEEEVPFMWTKEVRRLQAEGREEEIVPFLDKWLARHDAPQADTTGIENVSTDLTDDEIALVVLGLSRIARAKAVPIHNSHDVEASKALLAKLGFPFEEYGGGA